MNKIGQFELLIFVILLFSCSNGQTKSKKTSTTTTTEHIIPEFDIKFPETDFKVEKTENRDPNLENLLITNWILQGKDENGPFMYFVAHNELTKKLKDLTETNPNSMESAFQAMLTSSAVKLGGTDFKFTNIEYENFKGMESICKVFNGEGIIKSRVYRINDDIFMISAGGHNIDIKKVDDFLNSFKIK